MNVSIHQESLFSCGQAKRKGKPSTFLCGVKHPLSPLHPNLFLVTAERHSCVINISQCCFPFRQSYAAISHLSPVPYICVHNFKIQNKYIALFSVGRNYIVVLRIY